MTPARLNLEMYTGRFGARLRELRLRAKLTQAEFAEAIGVSQNTVSGWELGIRFPEANLLPVIAKTLKIRKVGGLFPDE